MASEALNNQTKKLLITALKSIMEEKPLDKITITAVVQKCNVSRRAFYYHFEDIYSATNWMLEEDLKKMQLLSTSEWTKSVSELLDYVQNNRKVCLCIALSSQHYRMEEMFYKQVYNNILELLNNLNEDNHIDKKTVELITHCYTVSIAAIISNWLKNDIECSQKDLLNLFEKTMSDSCRVAINCCAQPFLESQ
jgi:AcrR family transcriptional regulator